MHMKLNSNMAKDIIDKAKIKVINLVERIE